MNICWAEISRDLKISSKCSVKAIKNTTLCKLQIECPTGAASSPGSSRFHQAPDTQVKFHGRRWACGISNFNMTFWNDLCNLEKRRCPKGYHTHPNFDLPGPARLGTSRKGWGRKEKKKLGMVRKEFPLHFPFVFPLPFHCPFVAATFHNVNNTLFF